MRRTVWCQRGLIPSHRRIDEFAGGRSSPCRLYRHRRHGVRCDRRRGFCDTQSLGAINSNRDTTGASRSGCHIEVEQQIRRTTWRLLAGRPVWSNLAASGRLMPDCWFRHGARLDTRLGGYPRLQPHQDRAASDASLGARLGGRRNPGVEFGFRAGAGLAQSRRQGHRSLRSGRHHRHHRTAHRRPAFESAAPAVRHRESRRRGWRDRHRSRGPIAERRLYDLYRRRRAHHDRAADAEAFVRSNQRPGAGRHDYHQRHGVHGASGPAGPFAA